MTCMLLAALLVSSSTALGAPAPPWWVFDSAQKLEAKLPPRDALGYEVVFVSLVSAQVNKWPPHVERHLDGLEVFCGQGGIAREMRNLSLKVATFDRAGPHGHVVEDVATMLGALILGWLILSMLSKGFVHWSPDCSS